MRNLSRDNEVSSLRSWRDDNSLVDRDRIVLSHLGLVRKIALYESRRYGVDSGALFSEGVLALFRAIQSFDETRRCRFSTYATFWIRVYIKYYLAQSSSVVLRPIPRRKSMISAETRFSEGWTPCDTSLDCDEDGASWIENLPDTRPTPEEQLVRLTERQRRSAQIKEGLNTLSSRERLVLNKRYGIEKKISFSALALHFKISVEGVRQIEKRALLKLKKYFVRGTMTDSKNNNGSFKHLNNCDY